MKGWFKCLDHELKIKGSLVVLRIEVRGGRGLEIILIIPTGAYGLSIQNTLLSFTFSQHIACIEA